jgi:hypothetical protein
MDSDQAFGARIKAARGYAGGISQGELARRISNRFPGVSVSVRTIKRLETGDASVKGSQQQWSQWVAEATDYPYELLVWEYEGLGSFGQEALRWVPYSHTHWLRMGFNLLWRLKRAGISTERQRPLLERLRREGGMPLTEEDLDSPSDAWGHIEERLRREKIWLRHKEGELLEELGFSRFIGLVRVPWLPVLLWLNGQDDLPGEDLDAVRETVKWAVMDRFAPDRSLPVEEGHELSMPHELRDAGVAWGADGLWSAIEEMAYEAMAPDRPDDERDPEISSLVRRSMTAGPHTAQSEDREMKARPYSHVTPPRASDAPFAPPPGDATIRATIRASIESLAKYLAGEEIDASETSGAQEALKNPEFRRFLQGVIETAIPADTSTPQSAADAPLPEPPGELGRRAREHLPSSGDREQQQTPAEPDARRDAGR